MSKPLLAALFSVIALGAPTAGSAKLTSSPRECEMSIGPSRMMFSAFQTDKTDEIFCRHVPERGRTALILDAMESELRGMRIEFFVVRDVGQTAWSDDLASTLVAHSQPEKHFARSGTMILQHDFLEDGAYLAVVRATSDDAAKEYVGLYPFTVGETNGWWGACAVFAAACGVVALSRRRGTRWFLPAGPGGGAPPEPPPRVAAHAGRHDGASPTNPA